MFDGEICIDPEFRDLIPKPTDDNRRHLEEQLKKDGCLQPLVVWERDGEDKAILIDGHTRKAFCDQEHIEYSVVSRRFASRDEAKLWAIYNQLARRNLTDAQRIEVARKLKPLLSAKGQERRAATSANAARDPRGRIQPAPLNSSEPVDTRKAIAEAAGVSPDTVRKYEKVAELATPEVKEEVLQGEKSIHRAFTEVTGDQSKPPSHKPIKDRFGDTLRQLSKVSESLDTLKEATGDKEAYQECWDAKKSLADSIELWSFKHLFGEQSEETAKSTTRSPRSLKPGGQDFINGQRALAQVSPILEKLKGITRNRQAYDLCRAHMCALSNEIAAWQKEPYVHGKNAQAA